MLSPTQPASGMLLSRQAIWVKGYVAPKIGPMMRDDFIYSTTQLYNQSTLQPIETVSAIRLNLRRSNCDDCINRPRQMKYPDRVWPPQRGEEERRIVQEKKSHSLTPKKSSIKLSLGCINHNNALYLKGFRMNWQQLLATKLNRFR